MAAAAKPQTVLVTGASGCLGHPLATGLAAEGRTVVGLDIAPPKSAAAYVSVTGDVNDTDLLARLFAQYRFNGVVHCGGISGQMVAPNDPYKNCRVNIFGTVHLLEAARAHEVATFVYCSSQAAYGSTAAPSITEETAFNPTTVYGATKGACDLLMRAYRNQHGLNTTTLRIGRVYGPGRRTESLMFTLLDAAFSGRALRLPAGGGRRLQYVYDADIVSALAAALDAGRLPQPAYNISGPGNHSDEEIAAVVRELVPGADISFEESSRPAETFIAAPVDYSAASRDFGYAPQYDLRSGLAAYAAWFRNNLARTERKVH